jgi:hypothetical protein
MIGMRVLQAVVPDEDELEEFRGQWTTVALKSWALARIPRPHVFMLRAKADVEQLMRACSAMQAGKGKAPVATALWAVCVVLVTTGEEVSPLWAAMSTRFRNKVRSADGCWVPVVVGVLLPHVAIIVCVLLFFYVLSARFCNTVHIRVVKQRMALGKLES